MGEDVVVGDCMDRRRRIDGRGRERGAPRGVGRREVEVRVWIEFEGRGRDRAKAIAGLPIARAPVGRQRECRKLRAGAVFVTTAQLARYMECGEMAALEDVE